MTMNDHLGRWTCVWQSLISLDIIASNVNPAFTYVRFKAIKTAEKEEFLKITLKKGMSTHPELFHWWHSGAFLDFRDAVMYFWKQPIMLGTI